MPENNLTPEWAIDAGHPSEVTQRLLLLLKEGIIDHYRFNLLNFAYGKL